MSKEVKTEIVKEKKAKRLKGWQIALIAISSVLVAIGIIVLGVYFGIFYGRKGVDVATSEITGFERVENIVGNLTINDGKVENKILLSELVPDQELKYIKVSDNDVARVEGEWLVIMSVGSFDMSIKSKTSTYKVIDGYNVNTADEIVKTAVDKKNIVIQSDIDMTNVQDLPSATEAMKKTESILLYSSVYGNAYTIDASHRTGTGQYSVLFNARGSNVLISNVHIIGSNPVPKEGESVVYDDYEVGGTLVKFTSENADDFPLEGDFANGAIEYSILEKAHKIVWINSADVVLTGNVMREASDACVSVQTTNIRHSGIVMENNVLINPQVAGVLFWKMVPNVAPSNFAKLDIKGIFNVYNWKNEETAALMPKAEGDFLSTVINRFIREAVKGSSFDEMLINMYEHKWVHIGIVAISSSKGENLPVITGLEEIGYRREQFPFPKALEGLVGSILRTRDLFGYSNADYIDPLDHENIDEKLFEELWGDMYVSQK